MKPPRIPFLLATLALLALVGATLLTGALSPPTAIALLACGQLVILTQSRAGNGFAFLSALAPEQLTEFKTILESLQDGFKKFGPLPDQIKELQNGFASVKELPDDLIGLRKTLDEFRRAQLSAGRVAQSHCLRAPNGQLVVTDDCARSLGAIGLIAQLRRGALSGAAADHAAGLIKDVLGIETKTALSSSDIPLPIDYSGQVVELVSEFGAARRYGTVYPLGTGTTKLPRLGTDTAFGLIAQSAAITEKSPTVVFVTFSPEKFGGMVRIPSELDADSIVPLGQFIARYAARQIASVEDQVFFLNLDGSTYGAVAGLCASVITNSKVTQMGSTKTHYSDATLGNIRAIRAIVDAPVIGGGAYYMHPTFEQHLAGLNTAGDKPYQANGLNGATYDGFPIRWVDKMPAYSTSANVSKVFMLFGDLMYQYLGVRQGVSFATSTEAGFTTDEILIRALERFTIGLMATGAVSGLETAAS